MAIVLKTISDSKEAQTDLAKLRKSVDDIKTSTDRVSKNFGNFAKIFATGLAVTAAAKAVMGYSDRVTTLNNKLKVSTDSQEDFNYALGEVRRIAMSSRTSLYDTGNLYSKLSRASRQFGATQKEVAIVTEAVTKSIRLSGATAAEASSTILQFGQAMQSSILAGDELRSLRENAPVLLEAIARALKVNVGALKQMGEKGLLPSIKIFKGLLTQAKSLNEEAGIMKVTYAEAFQNIKNSFSILFQTARAEMMDTNKTFAKTINDFTMKVFDFSLTLDLQILNWKLSFLLFVHTVKAYFTDLWGNVAGGLGKVKTKFSEIFSGVTSIFKKGDNTVKTQDYFPDLDKSAETVKGWGDRVYGYFADLYDRLVGHSIVPDLIDAITILFEFLVRKPLMYVKDFVKAVNISFGKLSIGASLATGLIILYKYHKGLAKIAIAAAAVAASFSLLRYLKTDKMKLRIENVKDNVKERNEKIKVDISERWSKFKESFNESKTGKAFNYSLFGRSIKQALGIKDRFPGEIMGQKIDTNAYVGRGPQRMEESRFVGHDFLNAFPKKYQTPILLGFAAIFAAAIVKAFKAGPVRTGLLAALVVGATTAQNKTIDAKTYSGSVFGALQSISKFFNNKVLGSMFYAKPKEDLVPWKQDNIAKRTFDSLTGQVDSFAKGVKYAFSQNLFGEGSGSITNNLKQFFSLLLKLALLFKAGRAAIGGFLGKAATYPTRAAVNFANKRDLLAANRQIVNGEFAIKQAEERIKKLSQKGALTPALQNKLFGDLAGAKTVQGVAETNRNTIQQRVAENRMNLRSGVINASAGIAGAIGFGVAYQFGEKVAEGMENSPAWQKIATTIGIAMAGQAVAGAIGTAIGVALTSAAATLVLKFLAVGIAVFAVGYMVGDYLKDKIIEAWEACKQFLDDWWNGRTKLTNNIPGAVAQNATNFVHPVLGFGNSAIMNTFGIGGGDNTGPGAENSPRAKWEEFKENVSAFGESASAFGERAGKVFLDFAMSPAAASDLRGTFSETLEKSKVGVPQDIDFSTALEKAKVNISQGSFEEKKLIPTVDDPLKDLEPLAEKAIFSLENLNNAILATQDLKGFERVKAFLAAFLDPMLSKFDKATEQDSVVTGDITPPSFDDGDIEKKTNYRKLLESNLDDTPYLQRIAEAVERAGIKNATLQDVESLGTNVNAFVLAALDKIEKFRALGDDDSLAIADQTTEDLAEHLRTRFYKLKMEGKASEGVELEDSKAVTLKDKFDLVSGMMSELGLTFESFRDLTVEIRTKLIRDADRLAAAADAIEKAPPRGAESIALGKAFDKDLKDSVESNLATLRGRRPGYEQFSAEAARAQVDFSQAAYNMLEGTQQGVLEESFKQMVTAIEDQKDETKKANAQKRLLEIGARVEQIRKAAERKGTMTEADAFASKFNELGISMDRSASLFMKAADKEILNKKLEVYDENTKRIEDPSTSENLRRSLILANNKLVEGMAEFIEKRSDKYKAYGQGLAKPFVESIKDGFSNSFKEMLKGHMTPKEALQAIAERFMESVIDTFVESMTQRLFDNDTVKKALESLGGSIGDIFAPGKDGKGSKLLQTLGLQKPEAEPISKASDPYWANMEGFSMHPGVTPAFSTEGMFKFDPILHSSMQPESTFGNPFASKDPFAQSFSDVSNPINTAAVGLTEGFSNKDMSDQITSEIAKSRVVAEKGVTETSTGLSGVQTGVAMGASIAGMALMQSKNQAVQLIGVLLQGFAMLAMAGAFGATGGLLKGPGTGTSDSIMAHLSAGEFVVNAKATKKHLKTLTAINSGKNIRKFASGGLVSTGMLTTPTLQPISQKNTNNISNQQVINLTVTGDISRQTRSEILQMLPTIADGVNLQNKEKGYRYT